MRASKRFVSAIADPRPFFGFGKPVFHFLRCNDSAPTAHDFKSVKLAFRIHRMLLHKRSDSNPPRVEPNTAREIGASFSKDKCVPISL